MQPDYNKPKHFIHQYGKVVNLADYRQALSSEYNKSTTGCAIHSTDKVSSDRIQKERMRERSSQRKQSAYRVRIQCLKAIIDMGVSAALILLTLAAIIAVV